MLYVFLQGGTTTNLDKYNHRFLYFPLVTTYTARKVNCLITQFSLFVVSPPNDRVQVSEARMYVCTYVSLTLTTLKYET